MVSRFVKTIGNFFFVKLHRNLRKHCILENVVSFCACYTLLTVIMIGIKYVVSYMCLSVGLCHVCDSTR